MIIANNTEHQTTIIAKFLNPEAGYSINIEDGKLLNVGEIYEVCELDMGQSNTSIKLVGYPGENFSSTQVDFYENGEKINIYRDIRFNPYMRKRKGDDR